MWGLTCGAWEEVKPTFSELETFEETPEELDNEQHETPITETSLEKSSHIFSNGDNVEVCEGELKNLRGTIISIDEDIIMVKPKSKDLKETLKFQAYELRKYFTIGEHVKVIFKNKIFMKY